MPTTSLAGDRSRRARNPRDITGREYARQHADAKREAGKIDLTAVRKAEYMRGWSDGYDAGVAAILKQLEDAGALDPDEDDEPGEGDEAHE